MNRTFARAAVRAELKRAWSDGRPPNRHHLRQETGLSFYDLEREIIAVVLQNLESGYTPKRA